LSLPLATDHLPLPLSPQRHKATKKISPFQTPNIETQNPGPNSPIQHSVEDSCEWL
jgi:hypothetical protein